MASESIMIVNEGDQIIGSKEKHLVHQDGTLHRAFSVLLFDEKGKMLIQQRSKLKYHSPLLWSNACCSHQKAGESLAEAVSRRLYEELGISAIHLSESFILRYHCTFPNSLIENEIDHVYIGECPGNTVIHYDPDEIEQIEWVGLDTLRRMMDDTFTYWFQLIMERLTIKKMELTQICTSEPHICRSNQPSTD